MASSVVAVVMNALTSALSVFTDIMDGTGLGTVYMAMITVFLVVRFILAPIVGGNSSGASDSARKRRQGEE